jgi:hypothetical protein
MNFHRAYDISCVADSLRKKGLENAIEAVNLACTADADAWLYVESKKIYDDYNKDFAPHETMKNTIFNHMKLHGHSGGSISLTIHDLVNMATEYSTWKRAHEEQNSICEGEKRVVDEFKRNTLVPYYVSMSGGGSRMTAGPIVSEFLELYDRIKYQYNPELTSLFEEVTDLLGTTFQEKLDVLNKILDNTYSSPRLSNYRDAIKLRVDYQNKMNEIQDNLITQQLPILRAAIESRNPVALKAALNPGWGSMRFFEQKEYKEADALLGKLQDT